jgi:hypothetical protein
VVVVLPHGGGEASISAAAIEAGSFGAEYVLRAKAGEAGETIARKGLPAGEALAGILGGESFSYLTVRRADGTHSYLPAAYFEEEPENVSPVFEGGKPALLSTDGTSTRFLRPVLASDPTGANAEDSVSTPSGEALLVAVYHGKILTVNASASSTSTDPGDTVQFSAEATGGEPGEALTYHWNFGDGSGAEGPSASHAFTASGTYRVTVAVTGDDESGGEATPLLIAVGNPPATGTSAGPETKPTPATPAPGATGKKEGAGAGKGSGAGKRHGTEHGGAGKGTGASSKPGSKGSGGKRGEGSGQRSKSSGRTAGDEAEAPTATEIAPLPTETFPAEPYVPPAPLEGSPAGESEASPKPWSPQPSTPPAPAAKHAEPTPAAIPGQTVSGRLVSDFLIGGAAPGSGSEPSADSGSRSFAAAPASGSGSVPVVALLAGALVLGGIVFERRRQLGGRR